MRYKMRMHVSRCAGSAVVAMVAPSCGATDANPGACPPNDSGETGALDATAVNLCSSEPLVQCEIPTCGTVVVDIGGSDPQTKAIYDGPGRRCVLVYRVRQLDREKQCTNELF